MVPLSECENPELEVPVFKYDPKVLGTSIDYRHLTNIPGKGVSGYFLNVFITSLLKVFGLEIPVLLGY